MYYRQPRYFGSFRCSGNNCSDNCCRSWRIDWAADEVEKLKSAKNCSDELKELIEKSFIPQDDNNLSFKIEFNEYQKCPLLSESGLCRIQKELGAEYMSITCMTYPRKHIIADPSVYEHCNMSCREVVTKLFNDEKAMDLINIPIKNEIIINGGVVNDSAEKTAEHPELKYRGGLLEFFYEIIGDKKHDLETNIILGALAAQALAKVVERGDFDTIPDAIKQLRQQLHNGAQLKTIENIKPNYHLRFGVVNKIMRDVVGQVVLNSLNDPSGTPNIDYYNKANERMDEMFKDRRFFFRNIALNLLLELAEPFTFRDLTIFENYSIFVAVYACIKLNMLSIAITGKGGKISLDINGKTVKYAGDDRFIGMTSLICRPLCHSSTKQKELLALLKKYNCTSPAYLALLVK